MTSTTTVKSLHRGVTKLSTFIWFMMLIPYNEYELPRILHLDVTRSCVISSRSVRGSQNQFKHEHRNIPNTLKETDLFLPSSPQLIVTHRVFQVGRDGPRTAEHGVVIQRGRGLTEALQQLLQQEGE